MNIADYRSLLEDIEDQSVEVRISIDSGEHHLPISLIEKSDGCCLLVNCER